MKLEFYWTTMRMQGADFTPRLYRRPRRLQEGTTDVVSLIDHRCPSCGGALRDEDELATIPMGPGLEEEARVAQHTGEWFDTAAIVCHRNCVAPRIQLGLATRINATAKVIEDCASETSMRVREGAILDIHSPAAALESVAESLGQISRDMARFEETAL